MLKKINKILIMVSGKKIKMIVNIQIYKLLFNKQII